MKRLTQWLDRAVERICEWLNGVIPGKHQLVAVGYGLAGLRKGFVLPIDRRLTPTRLHMAYDANSYSAKAKKSEAKAGTSGLETDCGFWAYCHISGQPCQRCKPPALASINKLTPGSNGLPDCARLPVRVPLAPKIDGYAWYGCCKNPSGQIRLIAFSDCCTPGSPQTSAQDCGGTDTSKWCENWPDAKDWCFNSQADKDAQKRSSAPIVQAIYYCTVVIDQGECTS
jgi:hypothetical protein